MFNFLVLSAYTGSATGKVVLRPEAKASRNLRSFRTSDVLLQAMAENMKIPKMSPYKRQIQAWCFFLSSLISFNILLLHSLKYRYNT